jgi:hypothetical protein
MFVSKTKMPTLLDMVTLNDTTLIGSFLFVSHHPRGQYVLGKVCIKIKNDVMKGIFRFSVHSFFANYDNNIARI